MSRDRLEVAGIAVDRVAPERFAALALPELDCGTLVFLSRHASPPCLQQTGEVNDGFYHAQRSTDLMNSITLERLNRPHLLSFTLGMDG